MTLSWNAELYALHVLEFYPGMDPEDLVNQMYLDELRRNAERQFIDVEKHVAGSGVSIRKRIEFPIPSRRIETVARELQADLTIPRTHGRTGLANELVVSTAERVVRTGPCPVLSVKTRRMGVIAAIRGGPRGPRSGHWPNIGAHRLFRMPARCAGVCDAVCKTQGRGSHRSPLVGTGALQPGFYLAQFPGLESKKAIICRADSKYYAQS